MPSELTSSGLSFHVLGDFDLARLTGDDDAEPDVSEELEDEELSVGETDDRVLSGDRECCKAGLPFGTYGPRK